VAAAVAAAALAAVVLAGRSGTAPEHLVVSFLDVGQGDATLLQHGDAAVLVDTGPPGGPVLRRLREAGVRDLDVLVLTHSSADHDGEADAVLERHRVGLLLDGSEPGARSAGAVAAGVLAARRGVRRVASDAGQLLRAGTLELRVLAPDREQPASAGADPNDRATVLHVRDGAFDLLLTADAESGATAALRLPRVDLLKVAHHGSEDPGLPALLRRVRPRAAVIPVGPNTYGHPHPSTLAALRAVPLVRRTDRHGTVRVHVRAGALAIEAEHPDGAQGTPSARLPSPGDGRLQARLPHPRRRPRPHRRAPGGPARGCRARVRRRRRRALRG
jgi:competence protein ComEC